MGGVVSLAVIAVVMLIVFVNPSVKAAIEEGGTLALKVPVTVDDVDISFSDGKVSIKGLNVANPQGFKSSHAVKLGEIYVNLDPYSLSKDIVVIDDILIDGLDVSVETGMKGTNLKQLVKNVEELKNKVSEVTGVPSSGPTSTPKGGQASSPGKKFFVKRLSITNGKGRLSGTFTGGKGITVKLKDKTLTNLGGKDGKGLSMSEVFAVVMGAVSESTTTGAMTAGVALQNLGEVASKVSGGAKKLTDEIISTAGKLGGKLKGLLGK